MTEQEKSTVHLPEEVLEGLQQYQEHALAMEETARGIRDHMIANGWHEPLAQHLAAQVLSGLVAMQMQALMR